MSTTKRTGRKSGRRRSVDDMTDEEAAEFYYTQRHEAATEETVEVRSSGRLSRVISVRFNPDEAAVIEQRAADAGMTMSAYVRQAALERPVTLALDPATLERVREIVLNVITGSVAEDLAHIRHKIGA